MTAKHQKGFKKAQNLTSFSRLPDPDPKQIVTNQDPDPDPAKSYGSEQIRNSNTANNFNILKNLFSAVKFPIAVSEAGS